MATVKFAAAEYVGFASHFPEASYLTSHQIFLFILCLQFSQLPSGRRSGLSRVFAKLFSQGRFVHDPGRTAKGRRTEGKEKC